MKCPGQDMQYWRDDAIFDTQCPKCSANVEFYKDDTTRKCHGCGHRFVNPKMDFGCASYCQFAEQCLGTLPEEFMGSREDLIKDKVAVEMKRFFQTDFKSIRQATTAARYAENIAKEEGGNLGVILCVAYLHSVGLEKAKEILEKVGASEELSAEICTLLQGNEEFTEDATLSAKIIHDALIINDAFDKDESEVADARASEITTNQLFTQSAKQMMSAVK